MAVVAAPCRTSPIILEVASSVHTLRWSGSYSLAMNSATSPIASSNTYNFAMHASALAMLFTYPFRTLFTLSTYYIHRVCTGPHSSSSSTRWSTKWDITSKKLGHVDLQHQHCRRDVLLQAGHVVGVHNFFTNSPENPRQSHDCCARSTLQQTSYAQWQ